MKILVKKGSQKMWVKDPKKIKFWEAVANNSNRLSVNLGAQVANVQILKRVKD